MMFSERKGDDLMDYVLKIQDTSVYNDYYQNKQGNLMDTLITDSWMVHREENGEFIPAYKVVAAVRYFHEVKRYIAEKGYTGIDALIAFSGSVKDGDEEYTESGLNTRKDGSHITEEQTKAGERIRLALHNVIWYIKHEK